MKLKLLVILLATVVLASVFISPSLASAQASGSVSYSPTVYSSGSTVLAQATGGSFGSGSTVYFYISTTTSSSGIVGGYIGYFVLPSGTTTLSSAQVDFHIPSISPGAYYILAGDTSSPTATGAEFAVAYPVTVTSLSPSITITGSQPTTQATVTGSGWDPSSSVSLYLAGQQGSSIYNTLLTTFSVTASGVVPSGVTFNIPEVAYGSYTVVAQESSSSSPNYGITADSPLSVTQYITVSPYDISGATGSSFTVTGYGFPSLATITADGISAGSARATNVATTASTSGYFSVSASLSTAITTPGTYSVTVSYNTTSYTQSGAIFVSIPNTLSLGFTFTAKTSTAYPNSQYTATVYDFPSMSTVTVSLGPDVLGQVTTDSNGFGKLTGLIPDMPANTYYATAVSSGLYASVSVTLASYFTVTDPDGIQMISTAEYFPSSGHYTVEAFGLTPSSTYKFSDSAAPSPTILSVTSGMLVSATLLEFSPAVNGTLIFTVIPNFPSTATSSSITLSGVTGYSGNTYGYTPVQPPYFSASHNTVTIWEASSSETMTVTGIIPVGAVVYPGLSTSYNIYLGTSELTFTIGSSTVQTTVLSSTSSSQSITFTSPATSGVYYINITYAGQPVYDSIYSTPVVVSYPASSVSSGAVQAIPIHSGVSVTGYYVVGFSFYPSASVKLYYYTYSQTSAPSSNTESLTFGAFLFTGLETMPSEPSGTYGIYVNATYQTSYYTTSTTYRVFPSFTATSGGSYSAPIGSSVSFTMTGFSADAYYSIAFGSFTVFTGSTSSSGSLSDSFNIPAVLPGSYTISVYQGSTVVASEQFNVTESTTLQLLGLGTPVYSASSGSPSHLSPSGQGGNYAFPGQVVMYSWQPGSGNVPTAQSSTTTDYGSVYVTVYFNGTAVSTSPVAVTTTSGATYLNGSFIMPNGSPGNYWDLTLSWQQNYYVPSSSTTGGYTSSNYYQMPPGQGAFLQLISGNGATITGISSGQIAEITAAVNSSISTSVAVPISELNAAVTSINNTLVYIKTSFGTMEASIAAINASISSVNGSVVTLQTSIGKVTTSLSSINATLVSVKSGVATVQTSLGTITGAVTSISGNAVTIQSSVGTLKVALNSVNSKVNNITNYGLIFDIVIIALIAVTLGVAVWGVASTRNIMKRFGMKKD
jgi:hypothetical protein